MCVAFVRGCDRIIGPDDAEDFFDDESPESPVSAGVAEEVAAVTGENIAGLVLAALLSLYLIAALLFPEKF